MTRWLADVSPRTRAVLAGVLLLLVPTFFSVFPEFTVGRAVWWRALTLGIWTVIAGGVVLGGVRQDLDLDSFIGGHRRQRHRANETAAADLLGQYLRSGTHSTPDSYEWTVYLFDPESEYLVPVFPPGSGPGDVRAFRPPNGATGLAFQEDGIIVVTGEAVSDPQHGLTTEQQAYFREYQAVAAVSLRGEDERPFGCLAAISRTDDGYFEKQPGVAALRELAQVVSVVMTRIHLEGR
ncbi:MAG: hypothetical protein ACYCTI_00450 [Acidimicrobiales bacterium]